ncbi:MAG TPA: glycosyltransferase family 4 protein [Miltoncostaeaceae bacterium]|nr:glycosyltransferase family 4 protein [Miltoncostaeaceae bacterium]
MRIAFCVQRYGAEVAGGAEALCRRTAQALARSGDEVVVYTTTARDYLRWEPHYPPGARRDGAVQVRRFDVRPADPETASALVRRLNLAPGDPEAERAWALAQGPVSPGLIAALHREGRRHEVVVFWTYLYAHAQLGLPPLAERAVLVPLAHDEPMLRFTLSRGLTRAAAGLAFMTPEEALLVDDMHGVGRRPAAVVGTGLDPVPPARAGAGAPPPRTGAIDPGYALYLGRLDPAKGVAELLRFHAAYRRDGGRLGLVLAGRPTVPLQLPPWARATGWVDDDARARLLEDAAAVVLPSRYESLSLVALEAWQRARPTLANGLSEVLAGQTARSGGGLVYRDAGEYARELRRLERYPALGDRMGEEGRRFTRALTWPAAVRRWRALLAQVRRPVEAGR